MAYQQHYPLTLVAGLAEQRMYSSEWAAPLLMHQSGSAAQADCRLDASLAPPQQLSVPPGWRLIVSSRGNAQ
jgi:hypothetical protein